MTQTKTIKILSIEIKNPPDPSKKYTIMTVNYTDDGKLASRNVLSFVAKDVYAAFKNAKNGESYEITEEKNSKGYFEFVTAKSVGFLSGATEAIHSTGTPARSYTAAASSTYSTKEERDQTQIYIVRQSSIKHAIDTISILGGKTAPTQDAILALARKYEAFVFGKDPTDVSVAAAQKANDELADVI